MQIFLYYDYIYKLIIYIKYSNMELNLRSFNIICLFISLNYRCAEHSRFTKRVCGGKAVI